MEYGDYGAVRDRDQGRPAVRRGAPRFYDSDRSDLYDEYSPLMHDSYPEDAACDNWAESVTLLMYLVAAVLIAAANSVSWKRTLNKFHSSGAEHLEFFVNQASVAMYVVIVLFITWYRIYISKCITPDMRRFPLSKFCLMGLLDAVSGLCSAIGGAITSGQVQTLINQSNIPITMGMSYLFIRTRYAQSQYWGAVLIIFGALVAAAPSLLESPTQPVLSGQPAPTPSHNPWYGTVIFMISVLPSAFSNVYKEANFKEERLDVFYLTTWVSALQVLFGFLFVPILAIPAFGGGTPVSQVPAQLMKGYRCFMGEHVEGYACDTSPFPATVLLSYVIINFVYTILLLLITKHGSALLVVIASALSLPITNITFTLPFIMGEDCEQFSVYDLLGLTIVVFGFLLYSLVPNPETGDFMPAQGPAGQLMYITEDLPELAAKRRHRRRHSWGEGELNNLRAKHATQSEGKRGPVAKSAGGVPGNHIALLLAQSMQQHSSSKDRSPMGGPTYRVDRNGNITTAPMAIQAGSSHSASDMERDESSHRGQEGSEVLNPILQQQRRQERKRQRELDGAGFVQAGSFADS